MEKLIKDIFERDARLIYSELLEVHYNELTDYTDRELFISTLLVYYSSVDIKKKKHILNFLNLIDPRKNIAAFLKKVIFDLDISINETILPELVTLASKISESWAEEFILRVIIYSEDNNNNQMIKLGYRSLLCSLKWEKHVDIILKHMRNLKEIELIDLFAYTFYRMGERKFDTLLNVFSDHLSIGNSSEDFYNKIMARFSESYSILC